MPPVVPWHPGHNGAVLRTVGDSGERGGPGQGLAVHILQELWIG